MKIIKAGLIELEAIVVLIAQKPEPGVCRVKLTEWRGDAATATSLVPG